MSLNENDLERYYELNERAKKIEKEMNELKNKFNLYFDEAVGEDQKGQTSIGQYRIQRQIRHSKQFDNEKTVERLEQLKLHDCIQVIKKPDTQKIEAAITLGVIDGEEINDCRIHKKSKAIVIKKI